MFGEVVQTIAHFTLPNAAVENEAKTDDHKTPPNPFLRNLSILRDRTIETLFRTPPTRSNHLPRRHAFLYPSRSLSFSVRSVRIDPMSWRGSSRSLLSLFDLEVSIPHRIPSSEIIRKASMGLEWRSQVPLSLPPGGRRRGGRRISLGVSMPHEHRISHDEGRACIHVPTSSRFERACSILREAQDRFRHERILEARILFLP